jgi:hypothetical protein
MLVEAQAKASFGQHTSKRGLAHFQRIAPHVVAVQFDEVEGVEEHVPVMLAVTDTLERCEPVVIARDRFPIDDAGGVIRGLASGRYLRPPSTLSTAFMIGTLQPLAIRWEFVRFGRKVWRDEPGRQGTLQHANQIKLGNGDCNFQPVKVLLARCLRYFSRC